MRSGHRRYFVPVCVCIYVALARKTSAEPIAAFYKVCSNLCQTISDCKMHHLAPPRTTLSCWDQEKDAFARSLCALILKRLQPTANGNRRSQPTPSEEAWSWTNTKYFLIKCNIFLGLLAGFGIRRLNWSKSELKGFFIPTHIVNIEHRPSSSLKLLHHIYFISTNSCIHHIQLTLITHTLHLPQIACTVFTPKKIHPFHRWCEKLQLLAILITFQNGLQSSPSLFCRIQAVQEDRLISCYLNTFLIWSHHNKKKLGLQRFCYKVDIVETKRKLDWPR